MDMEEFLNEEAPTTAQRIAVVLQYDNWHKDGFIGDCLLRDLGQRYIAVSGLTGILGIVPAMDQIGRAILHDFAHRYIRSREYLDV